MSNDKLLKVYAARKLLNFLKYSTFLHLACEFWVVMWER
ncbi:hypothetical protein GXM_02082 [Nostoc sphaeroides CCNUC1]|uniref:Uncharacterized protein n=1 Tax=Nostoc sphaeroides CCNUC1 TaxID=2653204 RepID=A0A5P8VW78_9NOSO|nr:hypothetical protein GXM_02082 [Nostoc sphaeroides CCNUC1]